MNEHALDGRSTRYIQLDIMRGFIMVVMALDHANYFIARGKAGPELWLGRFPDYQGQALPFLTRAVTHLAAPGFFFLMGAGMLLLAASRQKVDWTQQQIMRHFVIRGAVLVFIQFVVENPAWNIGAGPATSVYFGVLFALGGGMIIGGLFLFISDRWLALLSMLLIFSTEMLLPASRVYVPYGVALRLWLIPGFTEGIYVLYPIMPWLGVIGLGIVYARWLQADEKAAWRSALWLGLAALLAFIMVRWLDGFGNIRPRAGDDWISFLNVVKYPPSLAFLLLTLGVLLTLLGLLARAPRGVVRVLQPLAVYGRVPLFFYILHLYFYAFLGQWLNLDGIGIAAMFPYWLAGLIVLWPLCWGYGRFKQSRPPQSLLRIL